MAIPEIIKELLENGVHFGHLAKHWNPKMKKFIFGKKKNIYIIDLEKTVIKLEEAKEFVKNISKKGGKVVFMSTKKQLRDVMKEQAIACGMPYVSIRWVGGFLTNFSTVYQRMKKYISLLEKRKNGDFEKLPRKEVVRLNRELTRMEKNYSGVASITELPAAIFLIDPKKELACVREANISGVPIVALVDTDADPEVIDYPIPGNDDAIKSVKYIAAAIADAIKEGAKQAEELRVATAAAAQKDLEAKVEDDSLVDIIAEDVEEKEKEKDKDGKVVPRKRVVRKEE
jgi:small subunit ribosomal protein S2